MNDDGIMSAQGYDCLQNHVLSTLSPQFEEPPIRRRMVLNVSPLLTQAVVLYTFPTVYTADKNVDCSRNHVIAVLIALTLAFVVTSSHTSQLFYS